MKKIIPKLKPEEYQELKKSIELHGLYHPITISKAGYILDGHHRLRVCNEIGIQPRFEVKSLEDPYSEKMFVIDTNLARRQLEPYSRVELILLKKEDYLKLGKLKMSKAGKKGNEIKSTRNHYTDKRDETTPKPALDKQQEEKNTKNVGFIKINRPNTSVNVSVNAGSTSCLSISIFG
jgi:ParB-like chromosome segregation protein Spo0J